MEVKFVQQIKRFIQVSLISNSCFLAFSIATEKPTLRNVGCRKMRKINNLWSEIWIRKHKRIKKMRIVFTFQFYDLFSLCGVSILVMSRICRIWGRKWPILTHIFPHKYLPEVKVYFLKKVMISTLKATKLSYSYNLRLLSFPQPLLLLLEFHSTLHKNSFEKD